MKTNTYVRATPWQARLLATGALVLLSGFGLCPKASAQSLNSFSVLSDVTVFRFNVNGTSAFTAGNPDVTSLLNTGSNNVLQVGWSPPAINNFIGFGALGSGSVFGGHTLVAGETLRVYDIAGVFLTNENGFDNTPTSVAGSTFTSWSNADSANPWGFTDHGDYFGYEGSFSEPLTDTLGYTDTGTSHGKDFTGAKQYGTFNFSAIDPTSGKPVLLGLDVYGEVVNANGEVVAAVQTGRIRVGALTATPEGSGIWLLAFGLVPLAGVKYLARRRNLPIS